MKFITNKPTWPSFVTEIALKTTISMRLEEKPYFLKMKKSEEPVIVESENT